MKPSEIVSALETLSDICQPVFLWGAPGVGKSQVVAQVAAKRGLRLVDVRAVLLDPVDLRGIPRIDESGAAVWCPPSFLPRNIEILQGSDFRQDIEIEVEVQHPKDPSEHPHFLLS